MDKEVQETPHWGGPMGRRSKRHEEILRARLARAGPDGQILKEPVLTVRSSRSRS